MTEQSQAVISLFLPHKQLYVRQQGKPIITRDGHTIMHTATPTTERITKPTLANRHPLRRSRYKNKYIKNKTVETEQKSKLKKHLSSTSGSQCIAAKKNYQTLNSGWYAEHDIFAALIQRTL